jgi:MoaA/NifB/PqqE/SkfB family radical SAM enzyme
MEQSISEAIGNQNRALEKRLRWEREGLRVPPFMIISVTNGCNLRCNGCYFYAQGRHRVKEMTEEMLRDILGQARDLGISVVFVGGGEPVIRPDLFKLTGEYPDIIFVIFSNGLLIDHETVEVLRAQRHIVPVISLEGYGNETDDRRGLGVFERVTKLVGTMRFNKLFFGISLTVTRNNFNLVLSDRYVEYFVHSGCKVFFFVEYIPVERETDDLVIGSDQKAEISNLVASFRSKYPALFLAFPGDEERFGGCLGAGRAFIHIGPDGAVEPCPFAPFSDVDLHYMSLKDALRSSVLLRTIRDNHDRLGAPGDGCAVWKNREWIRSLLH